MKKLFLLILSLFMTFYAFSQVRESKMPHLDQVTSLFSTSEDSTFYSIGKDGFVVKWNENEIGEHFQITNHKVLKFALHPNKSEFAIYETNDENFYSISVWNIDSLTKKFSIELNDSILSLSYTKKGSYLIAGTTTEQGTLFINSKSGKIEKPIKDAMNMIAYSESSNSEKTILSYAVTGNIYYHNLQNGSFVKKIKTENGLSNITSYNKNKYLAGIKNNTIFIIDAMNGKIVFEQNCTEPILFSYQDELYYFSQPVNKKASIFKFTLTNEKISMPKIYKNFSLKKNDNFSDIKITDNKILLGSSTGNIYIAPNDENNLTELKLLTDNSILTISDIAYIENNLFILANSTLFKTTQDKSGITKICNAPNFTKLTVVQDKLILWSQGKDVQVSMLDMNTSKIKNLFVAKGQLSNIKACYDKLLTIESASIVNYYNFDTNSLSEIYYGSGIQDAVLVDNTNLYIAKSKINPSDSSIIFVNTKTRETVPLKINCDFIYALAVEPKNNQNDDDSKKFIFAIGVNNKDKKAETLIIKFDINKQDSKILKKYSSIDYDSFIKVSENKIFSNVLSQQFFSLNNSNEQFYDRTCSFPKKIIAGSENVVILNEDSSLSWYESSNNKLIEDWYIMNDESVIKY